MVARLAMNDCLTLVEPWSDMGSYYGKTLVILL